MKLLSPIKVVYDVWAKKERPITSVQHLITAKSQGFGGNKEIYKQFGLIGHNGLDWPLQEGTPIYASHSGKVEYSGLDSSAGLGVVIKDAEKKTIYWHLSKSLVATGTPVRAGDIIGVSGNTGFSTGPHLHYGLKLIVNGKVADRDNGYDGAIDPTPYLVLHDGMEFLTVDGKEVWLVKDGKRTHVYNAAALGIVGSFDNVRKVEAVELEKYQDTGLDLAALTKE